VPRRQERMNQRKKCLVAMCGSHIANPMRLRYLGEMLDSYEAQTKKIPLYISVSYTKVMKKSLKEFIFLRSSSNEDIHFVNITPELRGQFDHYRIITKLLENQMVEDCETRVIFTDDDDIWAKNRVEIFLDRLESSENFSVTNPLVKIYPEIDSVLTEDVAAKMDKENLKYNCHIHWCMTVSSILNIFEKMEEIKNNKHSSLHRVASDMTNSHYSILFSAMTKMTYPEIDKKVNEQDEPLYYYRYIEDMSYDHSSRGR
jgi:hypothetical protein